MSALIVDEWIAKIVGLSGDDYLWNAARYVNGEWKTGHGNSPTRQRSEAEALAARLNAAQERK